MAISLGVLVEENNSCGVFSLPRRIAALWCNLCNLGVGKWGKGKYIFIFLRFLKIIHHGFLLICTWHRHWPSKQWQENPRSTCHPKLDFCLRIVVEILADLWDCVCNWEHFFGIFTWSYDWAYKRLRLIHTVVPQSGKIWIHTLFLENRSHWG